MTGNTASHGVHIYLAIKLGVAYLSYYCFNAVILTLFSQVCCFAILLQVYNVTSNHAAKLVWTNKPCILCVAMYCNTMWIEQVYHNFLFVDTILSLRL